MYKRDINHHEEQKNTKVDTLDFFFCFVSVVTFVVSKKQSQSVTDLCELISVMMY